MVQVSMDLNPAEFEAHYGREGWTTTIVNIPYPFIAKKQEISKKQAENKQKSAGGGIWTHEPLKDRLLKPTPLTMLGDPCAL